MASFFDSVPNPFASAPAPEPAAAIPMPLPEIPPRPEVRADGKLWLKLLGGAAALGALWYLTSDRSRKPAGMSKEDFSKFMQALAEEFHGTYTDVANAFREIKTNVAAQAAASGEEPKMKVDDIGAMLMSLGFENKLQMAQKMLCEKHGFSEEALQEAQGKWEKDPDVAQLISQINDMETDAKQGMFPLVPNLAVPPALTKEKMLANIRQKHEKQLESLRKITKTFKELPPAKKRADQWRVMVSNANMQAQIDSVNDFLKDNGVEGGTKMWLHVYATFQRDPEFVAELGAIEKQFSEDSKKILADRPSAMDDSLVGFLNDRIKRVAPAELSMSLDEAKEKGAPVLTLVLNEQTDGAVLLGLNEQMKDFPENMLVYYLSHTQVENTVISVDVDPADVPVAIAFDAAGSKVAVGDVAKCKLALRS